jgi:hypothetical protein
VPRGGIPGDRGRKLLERDDVREQRLHRRAEKGPRDAEAKENREDRQDAAGSGQGQGEERPRADDFSDEADRQDEPAVEMVCHRPGDEDEGERGQELHEPDDAEVERVARDVVHLPPDRDADDLDREAGEKAGEPIGGESAAPEQRAGGGRL